MAKQQTKSIVHNRAWLKKMFSNGPRFILLIAGILLFAISNLLPAAAAEVTIDGTAGTAAITHAGTSPNTVFISDQTGYAFYTDSGGGCAYSKTTNGGTSWGSAVAVAPNACHHVAIWYDKWTPGDTGAYIHMVTDDPTSDDLKYNRLDTASDTLLSGGTPTAISSAPGPAKTNTFNTDDNFLGIAKSTDGYVYVGVLDASGGSDQSYVLRCTTSCSTASNWSDTSISLPQDPTTSAKNNPLVILPQASGDMMVVMNDTGVDDVESKIYHNGTSTWDANWTVIDANAAENPTHAGSGISAVLDRQTYDVYLAYLADASSAGTNDDIRTSRYSGGSWTAGTDALTNASKGLITTQIGFNENNKDIYVAYIAQTTPGTTTTANVYWKKSTDGMSTWGAEQGAINSGAGEVYGLRLTPMSSERMIATYTNAATTGTNPRPFYGNVLADLVPPTYTQSAYRFFNNANSTDVGSALAAQDTAANLTSAGQAFRLRMLLHVGGDGARQSLQDFKLQYAGKGAGTCASPSGTPSSYTDVTTSTAISYYNNATPADESALTANANDPTHSGHTIRNQTYQEANNFQNSSAAIASGEDGKWDFSLYDNNASANTAYCFRAVKADGTAIDTYSQYPQITTVSNQAPNNPSSLAQTKTTDTTLNTGDWTNESSVKFTASVSDADSSDTLQLCVEKKALGVAFTDTEDSCGSGVAYSGTPVSADVTLSSLSDGTEYHWQARVKDAGGTYSSWVSYGGNAESARDFGVDTSAPTGGTVYDGTNTGVDATYNDNSLSSLSANWSGFNANASGLARYDYSIGTTVGGTDVKTWTSNGTTTNVTATGLTLQTNKTYYVNVRAVDSAGNVQTGISSNGQLVLPSLSFGISSNNIVFSNLNAANSYTDTKTTTVTTSTNAYGGYVVRAFATDALRASALTTIPDFNGGTYASPDSWQASDTGFGYTSNDTDIQGSNKFQSSTCPGGSALIAPGCYAPFSQTKPGDIVADHTATVTGTPIVNEQFTLTYRVTAPAGQSASNNYATTVVYSVTPIY